MTDGTNSAQPATESERVLPPPALPVYWHPRWHWRQVPRLFRDAMEEWFNDNISHLAAALSFYMLFSLAPLVLIAVAIAGAVFGRDAARGELVTYLQNFVGPIASVAVQAVIENASRNSSAATALGAIAIIFGATAVFAELQEALNRVWGVQPKPGNFLKNFFKRRLFSFLMVMGTGLFFLALLIGATLLAAFEAGPSWQLPWQIPGWGWRSIQLVSNLLITSVLFATIFKVVPDVQLRWYDVWLGAVASSIFFVIGKGLIATYLGHSTLRSAYGAAGSLVMLLLFVYYVAQILLFGAELTYVCVRDLGVGIVPSPGAARVEKTLQL